MKLRRVSRRMAVAASVILFSGGCGSAVRPNLASNDRDVARPGSSSATSAASTASPDNPQPTSARPWVSPTTRPSADLTPSPAQDRPARTFTVIGAGDVLLHDGLWSQAERDAHSEGKPGYDFTPLFAAVTPAITAADFAICHLETPLGPEHGPFSNYPLFSVPPQITPTLAAIGYDSCSTASNHALDQGEAGIDRTLNALDRAGVKHAGTSRNATEAATANLMKVKGVTVAHLSYTFSFNGLVRPAGKEWLANYLDPEAVLRAAHRAKQAGAEVVIVSIHWGTEYQHEPNAQQTSIANRLLSSPDVDLILGHHAHVVQPMERIGDKWVAYGMGNEVAWQDFATDTRDGIMPRFTFTEVSPGVFRVTKAEVLPIHMWLDSHPVRVYDIGSVLHSPTASAALTRSCLASLHRTEAILGERGAYHDGLIVVE